VDSGESIMIRFYQNNSLGGESLPDDDKLGGVQDFRFVPSGFTGGMQTASLFVTVVVVNELGESEPCEFALSDLPEDIPGLIQSVSQGFLPGLSAWVEVGGIASSLCPIALLPQPVSI
jgi:hypothetical protein